MIYHARLIEEKLRLCRESFPCVLLTGARQVGKSTVLTRLFGKQMRTFVFDPVQDLHGVRQDPDLFLRNNPPPLILDEIQHVPELVPAIKRHIDARREPGQFLITVSQQWQIMRRLAESLAGRVAVIELPGFCIQEAMDRPGGTWFDRWLSLARGPVDVALEALRDLRPAGGSATQRIWRGSYPEVQRLAPAAVPAWMNGYVATYLQRDVRLVQEVRDEMQFGSFLTLCAALTAKESNASQVGRDIGLSPPAARRWLELLRGTCQWVELPAWSRNPIKRLSLRPKGHFVDTGLACHLMRISSPEALQGHPAFGSLFESMAATECIKHSQKLATQPAFFHYRQHSGAEVDLVAELDGWAFPVEVKAGATARPSDARGIAAFRAAVAERVALGVVVYAGSEVVRLSEDCIAVPYDLV